LWPKFYAGRLLLGGVNQRIASKPLFFAVCPWMKGRKIRIFFSNPNGKYFTDHNCEKSG